MAKTNKRRPKPEMLPEYDFTGGIRGKYAVRYAKGIRYVQLDADVAKQFPDAKSVNKALRAYQRIAGIVSN